MAPRKSNPLRRDIVTVSVVLLLGLVCFGAGNWLVAKMVERRLATHQVDDKSQKNSACEGGPRLAGFAKPECGEPVQLHPMRFR